MTKAEQHLLHADIVRYVQQAIETCDAAHNALLVRQCLSDIDTYVLSQSDALTACRLRAMDLMQLAARLHVLVMQEPPAGPYTSGRLHAFLLQLSERDAQLARFFASRDTPPSSPAQMHAALCAQHRLLELLLSVYDLVRTHLGDGSDDRADDWFHACYCSLCIWQEDHYRRLLGMPSLIEGVMADMKVEMFLSWPERALERQPSLRRAWESAWQASFHEPSPFADELVPDLLKQVLS